LGKPEKTAQNKSKKEVFFEIFHPKRHPNKTKEFNGRILYGINILQITFFNQILHIISTEY